MDIEKNVMPDAATTKQWQEEEAFHRYQLIAPLLQSDLHDAKKLQLREKIAKDNNISKRSLYRYEKAYREGQFIGLMPDSREKHRSQDLPENFDQLLQEAFQLRREVPKRSVAQIITILEMEEKVPPGVLKRSTLQKHLYTAGYGSEQMRMYQEARETSSKRFCKPNRMMLAGRHQIRPDAADREEWGKGKDISLLIDG